MSIRTTFNPLGTLGRGAEPTPPSGWRVVDGCVLNASAGKTVINKPCPYVNPSLLRMSFEFDAARGRIQYSFGWILSGRFTTGGMNPYGGQPENSFSLSFNDGTSLNEYKILESSEKKRIRMELDKLNLRYIVDGQVVLEKRLTDLALPSSGGTIFLQHIGVPYLFRRIQYCADDVKILYRAVQNVADGRYAVCELYSGTLFKL